MNRRHFLKASSLLTLGACGGSLTAPNPEPPDDVTRYDERFDVRRFGAVPRYVNSTNRGRDNGPAFRDCAGEMSLHYGATMYVPASEYGYWLGYDPDPCVFTGLYGCHAKGGGKRASRLIYEPATTGCAGMKWDNGSTAQGQCSVSGIGMYGFGGDYVGTRYRKSAFAITDGSEFSAVDCGVNDWRSVASTGQISEAFSSYGKEIVTLDRCGFFADQPVGIHANPYEPSITADGFHLSDTYLGVMDPAGCAVKVDPGANFLNFLVDGVTNWVGGKYGLYWNETSGGVDGVGLQIIGAFRSEQMTDLTGATIMINRGGGGKSFDLLFQGMNLSFGARGIYLRGTRNTKIQSCGFHHQGGTVPLALDIDSSCEMTTAEDFMIPTYGSPLVSVGTLSVVDGGGAPAAGYQLPHTTTWN